ncbi:MAG: autotransporter domain-containing protein [Planctomycetaceae bacterium]|nr:autotransporter domain-containing protein [Planctomycetaceae bacterium]
MFKTNIYYPLTAAALIAAVILFPSSAFSATVVTTEAELNSALAVGANTAIEIGPDALTLTDTMRMPSAAALNLSGGTNGAVLTGANAKRIFYTTRNIGSISNLTFTHAPDADPFVGPGGGVYIGGDVTGSIQNSTFSNNKVNNGTTQATYGKGSALYVGGALLGGLDGVTFSNNYTQNVYTVYIKKNLEGGIKNTKVLDNRVDNRYPTSLAPGGGGITIDGILIGDVVDSEFRNNYSAQNTGGALSMTNNNIQGNIIRTTFEGNTTGDFGGGLSVWGGLTGSIEDSTFTSNTTAFGVNNNDAHWGGGAFLYAGIGGNVVNTTFTDNHANNGGGLLTYGLIGGDITESRFIANEGKIGGGGIFLNNGMAGSIIDSTFDGNYTSDTGSGGAAYINKQLHHIRGSTFTGNRAGTGGALALSGLDVSIRGSGTNATTVFSGNAAVVSGGAIRASNATLHILNPYLVNNSAGEYGGAIFTNSEVELVIEAGKNGILRGNTAIGAANDIHFNGAGEFIATVASGSYLDMHGGINGVAAPGQTISVTKTGDGTWYLGGASTTRIADDPENVGPGTTNWSVSGGTFHLRGIGETIDGATTSENGSIALGGVNSSFVLGKDAPTVLVVGGDNAIAAGGELRLAAGTSITTTDTGTGLRLSGKNGQTTVDGPLSLNTGNAATFNLDAAFVSENAVTRTGTGKLVLARQNVFADAALNLRTGDLSSELAQSFKQLTTAQTTSATLNGAVTIASGSIRGNLTAGSLTKSTSGTLSLYEPITVTGTMTMDGGKLDLYLDATKPIIKANEFVYNSGTLNIVGFTGAANLCDAEIEVIVTTQTIGAIPDPENITIANVEEPTCRFMIITLKKVDGNKLVLGTRLNWYNNVDNLANGLFGIADENETFELGVNLVDNENLQPNNAKGWDGTNLMKEGSGALRLTGTNEYTGGTSIRGGTLIAANASALGDKDGEVKFEHNTNFTAPELHLDFDGSFENKISGQGDIEVSDNVTYAGDRSGHTGKITINENSTFTTTAAAGNQQFDELQMVSGSKLDVDGNITVDKGTIVGSVVGTGDFTKTTDGALTIDGSVNVGGNFTLDEGSLSVNLDPTTVPAISAGGDIDFNNNALDITGHSGEPDGARVLVAHAGGTITGPSHLTINGQETDTVNFLHVGLVKDANGLYVATKLAWYNNDDRADDSTKCVAHGNFNIVGATPFTLGTKLTNTTVAADRLLDWEGNILTKTGDGTLILTADNSFSGGVAHTKGTLIARHENALGTGEVAVGPNATLRLEHDELFDNDVSGSGKIAVRGEQSWTGDWSNYSGDITLERGWISLGQRPVGSATRSENGIITDGNFSIAKRARLTGNGTIGSLVVEEGGSLEIGHSIGTLNVTRDATLAAGSHFIVEVDPNNTDTNDYLNVGGQATVTDAIVSHIGLGSAESYSPLGEWTILTAAGGVNGTFNPEVLKDGETYALLRHTILYPDANNVVLRVERNENAITDFATTGNQNAVASGLESLGSDSGLYNQILSNASDTSLQPLLDQLSGEMHASFRGMLQDFDRAFGNTLLGRAGRTQAEEDEMPIWVQVQGYSDRIGGDGNAARSTMRGIRSSIGGERRLLGGWLVGGAFQYGDNTLKTRDRYSKANVDSFNFGLYAGREWAMPMGLLRLSFGAGYGFHDVDAERSVISPILSDRLTSDYHAHTAQAFADIGHAFDVGFQTSVEPFIRLGWNSAWTNSFTERGDVAALSAKSEHQGNLTQTLGVRASRQVNTTASIHASAGWVHRYGSDTVSNGFRFVDGGAGLVIDGVRTPANMAVVSAGASFTVNARTQVHLGYDGLFGSRAQSHSGNIALQISF